jgi:hypothetical protein
MDRKEKESGKERINAGYKYTGGKQKEMGYVM